MALSPLTPQTSVLSASLILILGSIQSSPAQAQLLSENSNFINACRLSGPIALPIYVDAARQRPIVGQLLPNTQITLTGVVSSEMVQIKRGDLVGWITPNTLTACVGSPGPIASNPTPQTSNRLCYQVATSKTNVYDRPGSAQTIATLFSGLKVYTTTNPPQAVVTPDNRRWVQVNYDDTNPQRVGWVSELSPQSSARTLTPCS